MKKLIVLFAFIFLAGCANHSLTVERDGVVTRVNISYFMQDKSFKSLSYNPETGEIRVETFGSVTSEVVDALLRRIDPIP